MWFWQKKVVAVDTFATRLQRVEEDCMRRLAFVAAHLDRMAHPRQRWTAHLTVMDADIVPVGRVTHIFTTLRDFRRWPGWLYAAAGVAIVVILWLISHAW